MPLLNSIINWINIKRLHQIELYRNYPYEIQEEQLFKLLKKAQETEWGKKYQFESISEIRQYQDRVPIQRYEEIRPQINRLRKGEQNILWPGEIKWFAKSSGTTDDKSKFIPVSREALEDCHFRGGKDVLALYARNFPNTRIFSGKTLTLAGSHKVDQYNNQSYYGDLSAILIQNIPFWVDFIRVPTAEVALIPQWEEKLDKLTRETVKEDVTSLAGVPSWNLVMIKHILEFTGKNNLIEVWPALELFIHGGVSFIPYKDQFRKVIPSNTMNYMETYNASEGFFAIQDDPLSDEMLLMLDYGIFYEFIPLEEFYSSNPKVYHIGEVEKNKNYVIIISTNGGLWRYVIGDTIMFTSLFPHKVIITGRTKNYINAFGEELIIDNAEKAIKIACDKTEAQINEYTAGPVFMTEHTKGTHEWIIEFDKEPNNLDYFATILDNALMSLNSDYEAKRYKNITLDKPIFHSVRKGVFYQWFSERKKLGGQYKMPRLSNERRYIEELLRINDMLKGKKG
jgi:hypothetical protein